MKGSSRAISVLDPVHSKYKVHTVRLFEMSAPGLAHQQDQCNKNLQDESTTRMVK